MADTTFGKTLEPIEIDHIDENQHIGWSVVVLGQAPESRTVPAAMHDEEIDLDSWAEGHKNRYLHITPFQITGRRPVPARRG